MSNYTDLLKRLYAAHLEEKKFNLETYGERDFDPEEPTLHSEAADAIRELMASKPDAATKPDLTCTREMVDVVLEYNRTPRQDLFEYPHREDDSRKYIRDAETLVRTILQQAHSSATN